MFGNKWTKVKGKKIRHQYFNGIIYFELLCAFIPCIVMLLLFTLLNREGTKLQSFSDIVDILGMFLFFISLLIILSLANRFLLGKIICILNEQGIYYNQGLIPWSDIEKIEYIVNLPARQYNVHCSYAHVTGKNIDVKLLHAPHLLLRNVKRYDSRIETGLSLGSKIEICCYVLVPVIIAMMIVFLH